MADSMFQPIEAPKGTAHRRKRAPSPSKDAQNSLKRIRTGRSDLPSQASTSQEANQSHSPFLQLPAELRNQIYKYVLQGNVRIWVKPRDNYRNYKNADSDLRLLRANKQIYLEAREIIYTDNIFMFFNISDLCSFLVIPRHSLKHIEVTGISIGKYKGQFNHQIFKEINALERVDTMAVRHRDICQRSDFAQKTPTTDLFESLRHQYRFLRGVYKARQKVPDSAIVNLFSVKPDYYDACVHYRYWCCMHNQVENDVDGEGTGSCEEVALHCKELSLQLNTFCASEEDIFSEDMEQQNGYWEKLCSKLPGVSYQNPTQIHN